MCKVSVKLIRKSLEKGSKIGFRFFTIILAIILPLNLLMDWISKKPIWPYFTLEFFVHFVSSPLLWGMLVFLILLFSFGGIVNELKNE